MGYGKLINVTNASLETPKILFLENINVNALSLFSVQGSVKKQTAKNKTKHIRLSWK